MKLIYLRLNTDTTTGGIDLITDNAETPTKLNQPLRNHAFLILAFGVLSIISTTNLNSLQKLLHAGALSENSGVL